MKRLNFQVNKKMFTCPQCGKYRMSRLLDHKVSLEKQKYKTSEDKEVELFVDICDSCKKRNIRLYFQRSKEDPKKIIQSLENEKPLDKSLEDLL